ncbi:hypothetical protein OEZ85_002384 [Tetradesmus obliquus]|uniref:Uncharacterized protein n=1 Tax=Tetradesmus obliquus TaxID=3088 RepID=A0ABY8U3R8_TETOB|nr:hypothetical protein OEZ85_002384 [Tetradesmus obliquus]
MAVLTAAALRCCWAALLLAAGLAVVGAGRLLAGLLTQPSRAQRAVADRSHLQSLAAAAAAAAAAAGPGSLLSLPAPLLGGALEEVEQHRLGLAGFREQLQQLARDAAAAQQQLAASLQDSENDLAAALQTVSGLESDLSDVAGLLASQETVLAGLGQEAAAAAAAHRASLGASQRKVALLEAAVESLTQRLQQAGQAAAAVAAAGGQELAAGLVSEHSASLGAIQRKVALLEAAVESLTQRLQQAGQAAAAVAAAGGQELTGALSAEHDAVAAARAELVSYGALSAEHDAVAAARAELAAQVEALREQLGQAQARLAAAEGRAAELEAQLALLTGAQQQLGARLAALEGDAAAAAAGVKEAVAATSPRLLPCPVGVVQGNH